MNEKAKQLLDELKALGDRNDHWHKDFWITRSPIDGYTVVSSERNRAEHFSNAQRVVDFLSKYDKSLGKTLYTVSFNEVKI